ncbi:uncharacterized protein SPAPADRAFT_52560 [Spathaspora passalidarum NRRL Y-27907]|uniref:F-box domain-containing protein n=1 Tax=Spathaspora passalidarum (strain NRRL Y-27907 / 11-Y1) TaxID=619300 RepID=G3AUA0_SPAPN|nr:uncharacterized protein SPAPADRAFT_52560 [Spathaspora passalidarum NRRL Y-27907]EGW30476.1 hypothetical protein SPAPADRAFT_52560 [Spathaspora passalidarum NRRL Y-27907]
MTSYCGCFPIIELPNDIIGEICAILNQVDVLSLMLVNKTLYQLGLRKLYHSIYIGSTFPRLLVSGHIYTAFNTKYTIVTSAKVFVSALRHTSNAQLVKEIVTTDFEPDDYMSIVSLFPWVNIVLEYEKSWARFTCLDLRLLRGLELTIDNYRFFQDKVADTNYSIKELTMQSGDGLFNIIPKLKGLESLHISPVTTETLMGLDLAGVSKLKIKELFLQDCGPDCEGGRLFHQVEELFNLDCIKSFGFSMLYNMRYRDLESIIPRLTNVRNIFIQGGINDYGQILMELKPNSLHYLCLHGNSVYTSKESNIDFQQLTKIIENQEQSLSTLCVSRSVPHFMKNTCVNRFHNYGCCKTSDESQLRLLEQILGKGRRFPSLDTVILNGRYHLIKRHMQKGIEIIPLLIGSELDNSV